MLKNLLDACGAAIAYFCVGYAFAFGGDKSSRSGHDDTTAGTTFIGLDNFFGLGLTDLSFFFFQYTFTAASVTIVAGTLAERCQMTAYLFYSFFLTGFVYPVAAHAFWSTSGFLSSSNADPFMGIGTVDFSGSGVIHMTGGTTALIATYILGSRRGRFFDMTTGAPLETPKAFPGHSVSLQMLGSFILWFGWFGFNPGSALLLEGNPYQAQIGALCAVNTFLASAGGGVTALFVKMFWKQRSSGEYSFDLVAAMNGTLSGLVGITAGCATLEPWAALLSGAVAGGLYLWGSDFLIKLKLDDAVDAIPVHMISGFWGLIAVGLLSKPEHMLHAYGDDSHPGLFYAIGRSGADAKLIVCQLVGALFIVGWTFVTMFPFFLWLNYMGWFRCESVQELVGLDITYDGERANAVKQAEGSEEGVREEYLNAYARYRQQRQPQSSSKNRSSVNHSHSRDPSNEGEEEDGP
ncbi:Ammonium transporter 1 member [Seminavis robusta]|uniref:Ammonium transporter 1 member n=1 Tax=Seminavis robusta TaxID=568900 RepID=A0A9N8EN51_9STRA|nr:Ammonium transporter 1 member [Seminavis robusta]|eukprot:Sro1408_g270120.1 Ammonium transporter 1 member (464) ;mRNA; f:26523-28426